MSRKGHSITLSINERDKAQLEQIAMEQGMMWGDRPNISRLVEAIARHELLIGRNNDWSKERITAVWQAAQALQDAGCTDAALIMAGLLQERSELPNPLRKQVNAFLNTPQIPWRTEVDRHIRQQVPFQLTYRDATDRSWTFRIRHARNTFRERRQYLECWCEETEGNQDLPELQHNWTLRFDRIPEAALAPIQGAWRPHLDTIDAEIHLLGSLAFAYQAKTEDRLDQWLTDPPNLRRVVRPISNSFWFFREILPYGEDCILVGPAELRSRFIAKLRTLTRNYEL